MVEQSTMKLECGHTFHKHCIMDWFGAQMRNRLNGEPLNLLTPLPPPKNGGIPVLVHLEDDGVSNCACCRSEYTFAGKSVDGEIVPQKIIAKVRFAVLNGVRPVHYITNMSQFLWYLPKGASKHDLVAWKMLMSDIINDVKQSKNIDIDAMYCNCTNRFCTGFLLMNKTM